ncbi:MAG: SurA N-terminal domain-containing protein, partial [Deltaproteobacteria bacterium]|nr:SurA N-terminal domain-containing protein [Deltaproteobacteria bacterium]
MAGTPGSKATSAGKKWLIPALFFLLAAGLIIGRPAAAQVVDRLLVIVGNQVVTSRDLQQAINLNLDRRQLAALTPEQREEIKKKQLQKLVDNLLLAHKAAQLDIAVSDEEIERTIEGVRRQNGMSADDLKKVLAQQGMTYEAYRAKLSMDMQRTKLINREIKPHIIISEEEILAYAKEHQLFKPAREEVTLAQILLPAAKTPSEKKKLAATIAEIKKRFAAGEPFAKLAREYSTGPAADKGGQLGTFTPGDLIPEIEKVVFDPQQPVNELVGPVQTCMGEHLFLIL